MSIPNTVTQDSILTTMKNKTEWQTPQITQLDITESTNQLAPPEEPLQS